METKHTVLQKETREQSAERDETVIELVKTTFRDKVMYTVKITQGKEVAEFQFDSNHYALANTCYFHITASDIVLDRYSDRQEAGETAYKTCGECGRLERLHETDGGEKLCLNCIDNLGLITKGS